MYSTLLYRPSTVCFLPKFHRISPHAFDQALQCALVFGNVFFLWSNHKRFVKNGRLYHSIGSISCIQRQEHRVRMLIDLVVLRRVWNRLFRMALAEYLSLFIQKQLSHWSESAEVSCISARCNPDSSPMIYLICAASTRSRRRTPIPASSALLILLAIQTSFCTANFAFAPWSLLHHPLFPLSLSHEMQMTIYYNIESDVQLRFESIL